MRVGAVDLGTNSTRLLVADVDDGPDRRGRPRSFTITRLGEGVDTRRRLLPLPIARVRNVLSDFRRELERLGAERTLAVGTSAVRDAENGEAFLGEVEWSYGFATQLLSGDDEARMTWRGVTSGRELDAETMVVDIGGGSTELITAAGHDSIDVGCVRMTERLGEDVAAIEAYVQEVAPDHDVARAIGVAGTVTTLAAIELGGYDRDLVHGHVLTALAVDELLTRLASLPLEERAAAARPRARAGAGDRRGRRDPARAPPTLPPRRDRGQRARPPARRGARRRRAAGPARG